MQAVWPMVSSLIPASGEGVSAPRRLDSRLALRASPQQESAVCGFRFQHGTGRKEGNSKP